MDRTLPNARVLGALDEEARAALGRRCRWRRFRARRQVVERSDATTEVHFVAHGAVRVADYSPSGREVRFEDIAAGDCFGELSAIDGAPRSASVTTLEETVIASLDREGFIALARDNPDFALAVMGRLAEMVRRATARIYEQTTVDAQHRVCAELLRLAGPIAEDGTAVIRPVPHHADIASRIGSTRETVARVLGELTRQGIVRREGDALQVLDRRRLADMVREVLGD